MCGRYYVDDDTRKEIQRIVTKVSANLEYRNSDVYPSSSAPVIFNSRDTVTLDSMQWGFPKNNKKGVIFNARCESINEKRTFKNSYLNRRCIVPAKGYYEWDANKQKICFTKPNDRSEERRVGKESRQ